jgi:hypothetical protein
MDERLKELLDFLSDTLEPARQAEIQDLSVRTLNGDPVPAAAAGHLPSPGETAVVLRIRPEK